MGIAHFYSKRTKNKKQKLSFFCRTPNPPKLLLVAGLLCHLVVLLFGCFFVLCLGHLVACSFGGLVVWLFSDLRGRGQADITIYRKISLGDDLLKSDGRYDFLERICLGADLLKTITNALEKM